MKSCPECNRTYADETLAFCLADGALLSAPFDPQATLRLPTPAPTIEAPAEDYLGASGRRSRSEPRNPLKPVLVGVLLVAVFAAVAIALWVRWGPEKSNSVSKSVTPTPSSIPSPSVIPSPTPNNLSVKADASPTPDAKPDLSYLTGVYNLHPLENPSGDSIGTMTLTVRKNSSIIARGKDWKGAGRIDGKQGYYDWEFVDGKNGRTTILVNADGTLQGRVFGSGLDWWYLARRRE
jgi:hypothetical protein